MVSSAIDGTKPPPTVGLSLTAAIVTVVLPVALNAPPLPCEPALPSLKTQLIWALAGGASLVLP